MLRHKQDGGFTTVELVVAISITALLASVIAARTSSAWTAISNASDTALTAVQATRLSQSLHYDFAGADDAFLYGAQPVLGDNPPCTTWSQGAGGTWRDTANPNFVRPLFTLNIPTLRPPATPTSSPQFLPTIPVRVGYEVRRSPNTTTRAYELARVVCDATGIGSRVLVRLGGSLDPNVSGFTALTCLNRAGTSVTPPPGASTMSSALAADVRCTSFDFHLAYSGQRQLLRRLATDPTFQRLSSMVVTA